MLGVDPDGYDIAAVVTNRSLGVEAAALLQQLGPSLRKAVDGDSSGSVEKHRWIRQYVAHELLLAVGGHPIGMRATDVATLRARTYKTVARMAEGGYRVAGDLNDLASATVRADAVHPDDVTDSDKLAVTVAVLLGLLAHVSNEDPTRRTTEDRGGQNAPP